MEDEGWRMREPCHPVKGLSATTTPRESGMTGDGKTVAVTFRVAVNQINERQHPMTLPLVCLMSYTCLPRAMAPG
jgi:hypothetical protein